MEQTGIVLNTYKDKASVKIVRDTSCGDNCGNCNLCENKEKIRTVINSANAKTGDRVLVYMKSSSFLIMAFVAYILPIAITGIVAWVLLGRVSTAAADFITLGTMALSILISIALGKIIFKGNRFQSRITEVIPYEEN